MFPERRWLCAAEFQDKLLQRHAGILMSTRSPSFSAQ
jgi:hypothetical protein